MLRDRILRPLFALAICGALAACSTAGAGRGSLVTNASAPVGVKVSQQTATQKAVGKCIASVGFGVVVGGILGHIAGRNAGGGAVLGGVVGAGACAVFLELAAEEDQARMRALELEAIAANASQTRTFQTTKGTTATVKTVVVEAPVPPIKTASVAQPAPTVTTCRYSQVEASVGGQTSSAERQLWCRLDTGDWQPMEG